MQRPKIPIYKLTLEDRIPFHHTNLDLTLDVQVEASRKAYCSYAKLRLVSRCFYYHLRNSHLHLFSLKEIVLLADNRKTELLVNFCIAYRSLLEKHQLISVYNTAKLIRSAVDLDISGLSVDYESGSEQLASRAGFNEIDAVIYLRDGRVSQLDRAKDLLDVCDVNNIPYSTNIAMAEILILAIDRGDLDYREWAREDKAEEA